MVPTGRRFTVCPQCGKLPDSVTFPSAKPPYASCSACNTDWSPICEAVGDADE